MPETLFYRCTHSPGCFGMPRCQHTLPLLLPYLHDGYPAPRVLLSAMPRVQFEPHAAWQQRLTETHHDRFLLSLSVLLLTRQTCWCVSLYCSLNCRLVSVLPCGFVNWPDQAAIPRFVWEHSARL